MNFDMDIKDYIVSEFRHLGLNYSLSGDLDMDLLNLFTLQKKYVFPAKREVRISQELTAKLETLSLKAEVMHLKLLFVNQGDVNPFQSRKLFDYSSHDQFAL